MAPENALEPKMWVEYADGRYYMLTRRLRHGRWAALRWRWRVWRWWPRSPYPCTIDAALVRRVMPVPYGGRGAPFIASWK